MSLEANQYIGLIKFFSEREYLDNFLDGHIYCNTPEYYRLSHLPGVSDRNESCHLSFRSKRGDNPLRAEIEGKDVGQVSNLILRSGRKEGWLHCWAIIELPETDQDFKILAENFERLKTEFGPHYVFVDAQKSHAFTKRIVDNIDVSLETFKINYLEHTILGSSIRTKSLDFSYQREFRLVFSECESDSVVPQTWHVKTGFRDLFLINPKFELKAKTENQEYSFTLENT